MIIIRSEFLLVFLLAIASFAYAAAPNEDLHKAVLLHDIPRVKQLISQGADVNYRSNGRPLLVWAAQSANPELVKTLLEAKAEVNLPDEGIGHTALMRAIETQNLEITKILLDAKADPNAKEANGSPVLFLAIKSSVPAILQAVIDAGADVKFKNADEETAALIAVMENGETTPEMISILAKAGADLNAANIIYTPLAYAIQQGNKEVVKALLKGGADANLKSPGGRTPIEYAEGREMTEILLQAKANPNITGDNGSTPLIRAIENGDMEMVSALLNAGADTTVPDQYGNLPLQVANNYSRNDIADLLKSKGAREE